MTLPLTELAVHVMATKRIVRLVVEDEITNELRLSLADRPLLGYLVTCRSCVSVWAAGAVMVMPSTVRYALAASEAAILVGDSFKIIERSALQ